MYSISIIETKDGSKTLFIPEINEHYHSIHGALQESKHIFIQEGLLYYHTLHPKKKIHILEVGLGTGLNVLCTHETCLKNEMYVTYDALEPNPIPWELIQALNYQKHFEEGFPIEAFALLHEMTGEKIIFSKTLEVYTHTKPIMNYISKTPYDIIYFDAFAPEKQPEMWTENTFTYMYKLLCQNGILVTYCCKGVVKRMALSIGFKVEKIPGPKGGKREMLRLIKP